MRRNRAAAVALSLFLAAPALAQSVDQPGLPVIPDISRPDIDEPALPDGLSTDEGGIEDKPDDGPGGGKIPALTDGDENPEATVSDDLPVHFASYLAGPGIDDIVAVAISPAANIILAGRLDGVTYGGTQNTLIEGPASVLILPPDGKPFLAHSRVGKKLSDMAVSPGAGRIAIAGSLGVAVLESDGSVFLWHDSLPLNASRVAIGHDGQVALLDGKRLSLYSEEGRRTARLDLDHKVVTDVEIDSDSGLVFVTGFNDVRDRNGIRVQSAFVEAYDGELKPVWKNWSYRGNELGSRVADTHGLRLTIGGDGELYFLGEAAGGDNQFIKDPHIPMKEGRIVMTDSYNSPVSDRRAVLPFYARLDRKTGAVKRAQFTFPRFGPEGRALPNTFLPRAIAADELGNVYIGGLSGKGIPERERQKISGKKVGSYGGDPALLVVSADFSRRIRWTTFSAGGVGNHTRIDSIAVAFGLAVAGITVRGGRLVTVDPLLEKPDPTMTADKTDSYVALWRAP
jgi:hypothetical protein